MSNDRKRFNRQGELNDLFTHRTDMLALINTLANDADFNNDELPYANLSTPAMAKDLDVADLGFDVAMKLPTGGSVSDILPRDIPDAPSEDTTEDDRLASDDVVQGTVDSTEEDDANDPVPDVLTGEDEILAIESNAAQGMDTVAIDVKVRAALAAVRKKETTMQAFQRLTNNQPWIPFYHGVGPLTLLQQEERKLWDEMASDYKRKLLPRHRSGQGFHSFMIAWNLEAGKRYKLVAMDGDEDNVVLINKKSVIQLQEHFDWIQQNISSAARLESPEDVQAHRTNVETLNSTLRRSRQAMVDPGPVAQAQPIVYPQVGPCPVGNPLTFNADIVTRALQPALQRNPVPFLIQPFQVATLAEQQKKCPLVGYRSRKYCTSNVWLAASQP